MGERELVALFCLSSCVIVIVVSLPHSALGLYAVCERGIFLSYSLTILNVSHNLEGFVVIQSLGGEGTKGTGQLVYNFHVQSCPLTLRGP